MKKFIAAVTCILLSAPLTFAQKTEVNVKDVAENVAQNALKYIDIEDYKGSVYLQGLAEMALATKDEAFIRRAKEALEPFVSGHRKGYGSFISYHTGGIAIPEMAWFGYDTFRATAVETATKMWKEQRRNPDGHMIPQSWGWASEKNSVFVDCIFAAVPYMLYSGLLEKNQEYIDYAVWYALDVFRIFDDKASGLVHQARACGTQKEGELTEDCWSRGNGWGSMALASLLRDLPRSHKQYKEVRALAKRFFTAVLKYQDADGMWHQEMTWPDSYVEESGSALLLYGIGAAIETGALPRKYMTQYMKGLRGLMKYISPRGDVGNTCSGCLAWGKGTKADYASHPYYCNEVHAFGATLLCLSQALRLGVKTVEIDGAMGSALEGKIPQCHVRFISERKGDIAWENDRIAFRIYSRDVRAKVSSGVDLWTKYVDYPIIETWYKRDGQGIPYHNDNGEGWDFYAVGRNRGIGGSGIWDGSKLIVPEPYANYAIHSDNPDLLDFEVNYQPYKVGDDLVYESKRIRMIIGTHFYQVKHSIRTQSGKPVTLAVGLTNFGKAAVTKDKSRGELSLMEEISAKDGTVGSSVFVNPGLCAGFAKDGKDELVLVNVGSGKTVEYYVGAGWSFDVRFDPMKNKWPRLVKNTSWSSLNTLYKPALPSLGYLPKWQEGCFDIHAIATGKGEQTFLMMPDGTRMLIDMGDMTGTKWNGKAVPDSSLTPAQWVARYIKNFSGSDKIDYFMLTHLHSDHMGSVKAFKQGSKGYQLAGITELGDCLTIGKLVDRGYPDYSVPSVKYNDKTALVRNYRKFVEVKVAEGMKAEKFTVGSHSQFAPVNNPGKYAFDAWNIASNGFVTTGKEGESVPMYNSGVNPENFDENMFSNVMLFTYGKFSYYHGGDIGGNVWPTKAAFNRDFESKVADVIGRPVTVMKADHHATRDSSNPYFLWKMRPQQVLVHAVEAKHYWPDTVRRMLDPQMPGCKNIYATGDAGRAFLDDETFARLKPTGHVVVRVYPGGNSYQVFVLDSHSKDYHIIYQSEIINL